MDQSFEKGVTIIAIFHKDKMDFQSGEHPPEILANTPLSLKGFLQTFCMVEKIRVLGPFSALFCSRQARTSAMASIFSVSFDIDFQSIKELGQYASGNQAGDEFFYPGHENETYRTSQENGVKAFQEIEKRGGPKVLVVSHRPIIAGVVCRCRGVFEEKRLEKAALDSNLASREFVVFKVKDGVITTELDYTPV